MIREKSVLILTAEATTGLGNWVLCDISSQFERLCRFIHSQEAMELFSPS